MSFWPRRASPALVFVTVLACTECGRVPLAPPPANDDELTPSPALQPSEIRLFIDGTPSMQGFAVAGASSRYVRLFPLLESAVTERWPGTPLNFFKFGTKILPLTRPEFLRVGQPQFYGGDGLAETRIQLVLKAADAQHLTLIVSDLFQEEADAGLLASALAQGSASERLNVGLLGIRSEFEGTVYDVGIDRFRFAYSTAGRKADEYRPFYVVILGSHRTVADYYATLGPNLSAMEHNFLHLSPRLFDTVASFQSSKVEFVDNIVEVADIVTAGGGASKLFRQLEIRDAGKPAVVTTSHACSASDHVPSFPEISITPVVQLEKLMGGSFVAVTASVGAFTAMPQLRASPCGLRVTTTIDPQKLLGNGIYRARIDIHPTNDSFLFPLWVSEWNMDVGQLQAWTKAPGSFRGWTTLNLERLVRDVWFSTVGQRPPIVARLFYYIRKA